MTKAVDTNTEEKILEAAKDAFMKYGLYGARMQDIADNAGINKALLHYYFRNKETLFDKVFDGALSKYFEQMTIFSDTSLPVTERIFIYIERIINFFSEYPMMSMFIIKEISVNPELFRSKIVNLKPKKGSSLISVLRDGIESGEIKDTDPIMFIVNLHSLCAYPFLASPIFKSMINMQDSTWEDPGNNKLKASVKDFVTFKLSKHNKQQ